jgi:hypothetical protein
MKTDWELDDNGHIIVRPVIGWDMSLFRGMQIGVQLQFLRLQGGRAVGRENIQLGLTSAAARQLALDLVEIADRIERTDRPAN